MILSYRAGRYGRLDTLNSKIHPCLVWSLYDIDGCDCESPFAFQILDTVPGWCNNSGMEEEEEQEEEQEYTWLVGSDNVVRFNT